MSIRSTLSALGAGFATFVLVSIAVIEVLDFEFSALVGLPVGLIVGAGVAVAIFLTYANRSTGVQRVITSVASFGYAILVLLGVRYVNLGGLRSAISVQMIAGIGVACAVLVFLGLYVSDAKRGK